MPDIFLGEFSTDLLPPDISNQFPSPLSTNVTESTVVSFRATDASGIDLGHLQVSITSVPAVIDGVAQAGFSLATVAVPQGYDVFITPASPLPSLFTALVSVTLRDLAPLYNEGTYSWQFVTGDTVMPLVVNAAPTPSSTGVPSTSTIEFDVVDDSGLDTSTLQVSLNSAPAVVNGAAEPGFSVSYAAITGGTAVIVTPAAQLSSLTAYTVSVTARDLAVPFNESTISWSFTTADEDAPVVVNQFPTPMSTSVAESTAVSFTALDVSGIDISRLQVTINSVLAVENGAANSGYGVSYTPVAGGVDVVVTHATPFPALATIIVSVHVADLAVPENSATYTWSFATGDSINPLVLDPEPGINDVNVSVALPVSFDVIDPSGSGINLWSLNLSLTSPSTTEDAVVNGVAGPGFLLSLSAVPGGYRATVERSGPLAGNTVYTALASVEDLAGNPGSLSWSWTTESGVVETPRLSAVGGDGLVFLSWYVNPLMGVTSFILRRSTFSPPTSPDQGTVVYSGTSTSFSDVNVINGQRYFYTVFVIRYFLGGEPQYVPYDPLASASDVPDALRAAAPRIDEYIPLPREFGPTAMPWDGGLIAESWGRSLPQGGVRINDLWTLGQGTAIRSPMSGIVTLSSPGAMVVENAAGIRVSVLGQVSPSTGIVSGSVLEAGDALATCVSGSATFDVAKLPSGREGLRTIRPEYFYKTVERRH
jgi:hypothetical protein